MDGTGRITLDGFLRWARKNAMAMQFVEMVSQISAVQFGLRPDTNVEEGRLISDMMARHALHRLGVRLLGVGVVPVRLSRISRANPTIAQLLREEGLFFGLPFSNGRRASFSACLSQHW